MSSLGQDLQVTDLGVVKMYCDNQAAMHIDKSSLSWVNKTHWVKLSFGQR